MYIVEVVYLENIFADLSTQITSDYSEGMKEKPKRNAFFFITADPVSRKICLKI